MTSPRPERRLTVDGRDVTPLEVADTRKARRRGLLGRDGIEGALLLKAASVHTIGMRFPIDVAFCDRSLQVGHTATLRPWRLSRLRPRLRTVIEAEAGSFAEWGLKPGSQLAIEDQSGSRS